MKKLVVVAAVAFMASACNPQTTVPPASIPSATDSQAPVEYKVTNMSPQKTKAGTPFNVQLDKGSGISFEINRPVPPGEIRVLMDGKPLGGVATNGVIITATIPDAYLAKPGSYPVTVQLPGASSALPAGSFTVE